MRNTRNNERRKAEVARLKNLMPEVSEEELDKLIASYILNKGEFDSLKKITERDNGRIKDMMLELNLTERQVGDKIVKRIVQERESLNEERLLELVKKWPQEIQSRIIKTREYADTDCLEDAIYSGSIPSDYLIDMDTCREVKEVVTLRVSKVKKAKEEE